MAKSIYLHYTVSPVIKLRRIKLRILITLLFATLVITSPMDAFAAGHKGMSATKGAIEAVKKNPGTSTGIVACGIAVAFFPPAVLICGGTIAAGLGIDQANQ